MKGNNHEKNLDALNAGIAKSREEIAALTAGLQKLEESKIDAPAVDAERPPERPVNGERHDGAWAGFWQKLDAVEARGEKVAKGLAVEIQRHPLIGGAAAFGLGFAIAKLLFKRGKKVSAQ
jgi:hypothetical protein